MDDISVQFGKTEFMVGDRCRVREWDDMLKEFGRYLDGINTPVFLFTERMRYLCGREFTIASIHLERCGWDKMVTVYRSEDECERRPDMPSRKNDFWYITSDMLELLDSKGPDFVAPSLDWLCPN